MVQATIATTPAKPRHASGMKISSKENLYKAELEDAIKSSGRDSLQTGLALLNLAELYDKQNNSRDSEPVWREIERILANHVKSRIFKKSG